ncbi:MAG TPA: hypothetical protein VIP80_07615 [Gemmatimonadales bacterium]|jgi:hypothetical protein
MHFLARCFLLALALPAGLAAQTPDSTKSDSTPHKATRLFRSREPLEMWMQADFKAVFKDRDSMSTKKYPATLKYVGEKGDTNSLEVQLSTRGHFRLRTCEFLPLKVYFDKEKTKGTPFGGEASLKLTPHCMKGDRYAQNIYVEYAIYGMYNVLTPVSLKARLANITWIDPNNPKFTVTRPGFWTQDEDDMAKEVRGKVLMQQGGKGSEMDPTQMAITDVFQYMIGNTDYSLSYLHNYRIVQTDTSMNYYPMAYDFDWSGLVDAPYAFPDPRLGIKRTTDRLYRGGCHPPEVLSQVVQPFKAKKDSIYGVLRGIKGLAPARLKEAESFLDEFYKELDNPGTVRRVFNQPCPR